MSTLTKVLAAIGNDFEEVLQSTDISHSLYTNHFSGNDCRREPSTANYQADHELFNVISAAYANWGPE